MLLTFYILRAQAKKINAYKVFRHDICQNVFGDLQIRILSKAGKGLKLQVFRSAPSNIDVGGANECLQN
jgi:hypothetical protein